ncbi:MAG TPA: hypothetical protein DIT31_10620 [Methylophaga sp.]|nr:hypothetical protein [Methylophaga sp.]
MLIQPISSQLKRFICKPMPHGTYPFAISMLKDSDFLHSQLQNLIKTDSRKSYLKKVNCESRHYEQYVNDSEYQ